MTNQDNVKMPSGIPFIIGNEMAERFSYYGMKTILTVFMTTYLLNSAGEKAPMGEEESKVWFHTFAMGVYFFPIIGAFISDVFWGKYKTILLLSIVYCLGHLALSLDDTRLGLSIGLTLIAIGSGGIKPCVSANLGDQFDETNKTLISKVFNYFYLAINFGSLISTILIPILLNKLGPAIAFGIPGVLMFIATFIFWLGRKEYIVQEPVGLKAYKEQVFTKEGLKAISSLLLIYLCMAFFWSLYEQTGSSWVIQANHALFDKHVDLSMGFAFLSFLKFELLPAQLQAINPVLVLTFVPVFTLWIYPLLDKNFKLTPLRKISIGMFVTAISFAIVTWVQYGLDHGHTMSVAWHVLAYIVLTIAEVMVYGTGLEFSYTQAPKAMKSMIMGFFLLSISLGNFIAAFVNAMISDEHGASILTGVQYYAFFTGLMVFVSVLFIGVAVIYKEREY
jgi:POT family proton-dependent oligopeptide transporter